MPILYLIAYINNQANTQFCLLFAQRQLSGSTPHING